MSNSIEKNLKYNLCQGNAELFFQNEFDITVPV
jgi:hypothetical protein